MNVEGPSCSTCKPGTFHLSQENKDGCLSCFCMGVTQQCSSSTYYRDMVRSPHDTMNGSTLNQMWSCMGWTGSSKHKLILAKEKSCVLLFQKSVNSPLVFTVRASLSQPIKWLWDFSHMDSHFLNIWHHWCSSGLLLKSFIKP